MIDHIETKQIKLSKMIFKFNQDIANYQSDILQSIILDDIHSTEKFYTSFDNLNDTLKSIENFVNKNSFHDIDETIHTIKNRVIEYKAFEESLIKAIKANSHNKVHNSLIDFKTITLEFSSNTDEMIRLVDIMSKEKIQILKSTNSETQKETLYTFILAVLLILFAVYKLSKRHSATEKELILGELAEIEQKKLQSQLLKYNDDLEEEISKKTAELHQKIYTHFLSGLPNRNKLLEDSYIYKFKQMALLNIDKFQKFNDVYGEEVGNIALKLTADFLTLHVDDNNTLLYHIGGDEFVFAVKDSTKLNNTHFIEKVEDILKQYRRENFIYEDKRFTFMMSAGLAFSGSRKMLAYADMALKDAKKRNVQISIFNDDKALEKLHKEDIECHKKLIHAIDTNNIISFFQPIAPIQDASLDIKYESLVRIREDDGNIIAPFRFIDVAKQNRVYHKLTQAIINNTFEVISKYDIPCSINISMEDIENDKTIQMLYAKFDEFEYNHHLSIELLETEEFKDYKRVYDFCLKVRSYGIKVALDDFGAGYSNFSHALNLPIDYIKIDASLISNIDRDMNSQIMVETIVGLAHKLNIQTIAEFVSSKEILDVVKRLNIDYAQGYYIGKPEEIEKHIPYLFS
ncbi:diguanylate cyclase/phosphodiesterase [Sulfurimonas gotlandica GD1]|uniref:Diguanylate cyclase/phosphodiesterase n=1 Tax=Sulfurimonas gotlandica (strain DSM 19862 / JCM 16533 / GD1) TaxID=929558 RepID=B6BIR1_SULGG|nr:bifunctional diguanylate cyclase/phosphodiesterase [Sulfurimonas gotlandica]EDZ63180.1 ggdef family protein [Sulfurimonas gotlandica GD1]EHP30420.1 diguanylate cyclase/phosphodiesterase [Sulfurimonas gotlandica GD1]